MAYDNEQENRNVLQDAYLVRFWRASVRDTWRVTLIPVGEDSIEQHFGALDDLYRHLQKNYAKAEVDLPSHTENHEGRAI